MPRGLPHKKRLNILSNQSTKMPPLSKLPRQVREETRNSFLFNTHNLFL
jgi:hypothetical protein